MPTRTAQMQEDTHFKIMRILQDNPDQTQRELAGQLGMSVGGLNYCLNALIDKGLVKMQNFSASKNKFKYVYLLTPQGMAEKIALTGRFLLRKMQEFDTLKAEIESLQTEVGELPLFTAAPKHDHRHPHHSLRRVDQTALEVIPLTQDIRWKQRFGNFQRAFKQLSLAMDLKAQRPLSDLEQQGLIQDFEFTHELAWNVLKDYLEMEGIQGLVGSRSTAREAFKRGLVTEGEVWIDMIEKRNLSSHTYNQAVALMLVASIAERYFRHFVNYNSALPKKHESVRIRVTRHHN